MEETTKEELYKEAAFVGLALVPMWWLVKTFTTATNMDGPYKEVLDIVIAGSLFHLTAEESGLNTWYLSNSHAAKKQFSQSFRSHDAPLRHSMGWIRGTGFLDRS